jgi:EamA-like transporter family
MGISVLGVLADGVDDGGGCGPSLRAGADDAPHPAVVAWAGYILLTQRVGAQLHGLHGLTISLSTAALAAAPIAAWPALRGLTPVIALQALGLAALVPLLPFTLELLALRRMRVAAFGTLMALEPAMAAVIGLLLLAQLPAPWQIAGITLVVTAGIGAQRTGPAAMAKAAASPSRPAGPPALTADHPTGHPGDNKTARTTAAPGTDARRAQAGRPPRSRPTDNNRHQASRPPPGRGRPRAAAGHGHRPPPAQSPSPATVASAQPSSTPAVRSTDHRMDVPRRPASPGRHPASAEHTEQPDLHRSASESQASTGRLQTIR